MTTTIKSAAVIGAGSMGSGIAAQFANAGVPVLLLDVTAEAAAAGIARQLKAGGFMHPSRAALVTPGSTDTDLAKLRDADWIVEAIVEDLATKRALFTRLDNVRAEHAVISSNTSTIPLAKLIEGQTENFSRAFLITHFFNPPRVMPLLEVVSGPATSAAAIAAIREAGDGLLGKTVLACRDTPGFIANRIGCFWIAMAIIEAMRAGLTVEEADAIGSTPFKIPPIGAFGVLDLVGVDLVPLVWGSMQSLLPATDLMWRYDLPAEPLMQKMIAEKLLGRKTGAGFYRVNRDGAKRTRDILDLTTCTFRPERKPELPSLAAHGRDLRRLCEQDDAAGRYAWRTLSRLTLYSAAVGPDIADTVADVDEGMRLGYGWGEGPFQFADRAGTPWIAERLAAEGETLPPLLQKAAADGAFYPPATPRPAPTGSVASLRTNILFENSGAVLSDIGDGVACLEHRTKMNIFDDKVFSALGVALTEVPKNFRALVIANDHPRAFSCGADLGLFGDRVRNGDFAAIEDFVATGQRQFLQLKYASFPVVGAAFGLALGGGCEVLLHCHEVVAHAELTIGLPEASVGLIPAWGGCTQLLLRWSRKPGATKGPLAPAAEVFPLILRARISTSALEARDLGTLLDSDSIVMSRRRLLATAKARAVALADAAHPRPAPESLFLAGPSGKSALMVGAHGMAAQGQLSANDLAIADALATVLTGGTTDPLVAMTEEQVMALERAAVLEMAHRPATLERIAHTLATGKPLRN
jgi:3-hydroxyacyl-CoA dehydrogenase